MRRQGLVQIPYAGQRIPVWDHRRSREPRRGAMVYNKLQGMGDDVRSIGTEKRCNAMRSTAEPLMIRGGAARRDGEPVWIEAEPLSIHVEL